MKLSTFNLGIIGTGNMGRAMIKGLLANDDCPRICVYDISAASRKEVEQLFSGALSLASNNNDLASRSDIIILAVKPQVIKEVLAEIAGHLQTKQLLISIVAGVPLAAIEDVVGRRAPVIRVMPNTPALVQRGVSALAAGSSVNEEQQQLAAAIFSRVGKIVNVPEHLMDAVTAVSGSGPAYAFLVIEAMIDAAVNQGLPRDIARTLVIETFSGACAMLQATGQQPMALKDMVTSPGGTTIAGLAELEKQGVRAAFFKAISAACERAHELGSKQ
ncbi:MAG: pyrroline-5-carboxylate reductase [Deltaproteobacteria bacterium]|nr:pyrroline-5-carboxylate reductase [Candidatus Anaeroferrophillus wilburensis]MBN2889677.1 pyrroline-5-carboxylate reductase [Deltaproteobacteria bacterium]